MSVEEDFIIEHFGVKGMQWGIRNDKQKVSGPAKPKSTTQSLKAKRGKQVAAALLTGPIGLIVYNKGAKPLHGQKPKSKAAKPIVYQSEKSKLGKQIASTILAGPIGLIGYNHIAKPVKR